MLKWSLFLKEHLRIFRGSFWKNSNIEPDRTGPIPVGIWNFPETYSCYIPFESSSQDKYHTENPLENNTVIRKLW